MEFFDVAPRLCEDDGPIAALVDGSSCIALHYNSVPLTTAEEGNYDGAIQ